MKKIIKEFVKKSFGFFSNYALVYFVPKAGSGKITVEDAENILKAHSPNPETSALWSNCESKNDLDLTIIIPVYNVERYLEKCLNSVINQKTSYTYEVIVVNDCSPDKSGEILENYKNISNVTILNHEINRGLSAARNTGLQKMRGKYVMFVDSDDFLPDDSIQGLMETACGLEADIVQGGYQNIDADTEDICGYRNYEFCENVPANGVIEGMAWGKVYRSSLFCNVCFPEKYWYEDTIITALVSHLAEFIVTIPHITYSYRKNIQGIVRSSAGKPKSIDTFWVHRCVLSAREELGMETDIKFYEHLLRMMVLSYKRTSLEPESVKISLFVLFGEMLKSVRKDDFVVNKRYKNLEKSIIEKDYKKYVFLCKWM